MFVKADKIGISFVRTSDNVLYILDDHSTSNSVTFVMMHKYYIIFLAQKKKKKSSLAIK